MDYYILKEGNKVYKLEKGEEQPEGERYKDALDHAVKTYINTRKETKLLIDVATVNDDKCTFAKNIQLNDTMTMEWTDKKE